MSKSARPRLKKHGDLTPETTLPTPAEGRSGPREEYDRVIRIAAQTQGWYLDDRKPKRRASKILRLAAILFGGAGALAPLIAAKDPDLSPYFGYVLLLLAGTSVATDRALGLSTGWTRDIQAATRINLVVSEFRFMWVSMEATESPSAPDKLAYLSLARSTEKAILDITANETLEWMAEFSKANELLETKYANDNEARPQQ